MDDEVPGRVGAAASPVLCGQSKGASTHPPIALSFMEVGRVPSDDCGHFEAHILADITSDTYS